MDTIEELIEEALNKGYKSKWVLYRGKEAGIKMTVYDVYCVAKAFNHNTKWVTYMVKEFDISTKNNYPNIYFKGTYLSNLELRRAYIEWCKKVFDNKNEFQKMKKQYYHYLSRKKG